MFTRNTYVLQDFENASTEQLSDQEKTIYSVLQSLTLNAPGHNHKATIDPEGHIRFHSELKQTHLPWEE